MPLLLNSQTIEQALTFTGPAAVFLLAAGATLHCSLMCGPLVASLKKSSESKSQLTTVHLEYQIGRSVSYTVAGFVAASIGHVLRPNPVLSGLFLIIVTLVVATQLFQIALPIPGLQSFTAKLMRPVHFALRRMGRFQALGSGLLTPLIPCGQLWMVLGFSALATSQLEGAAISLGFSLLSAPGVYGFHYLKDWIMSLGAKSPTLVRIGIRSLVAFILALSAFRFSTLALAQSRSTFAPETEQSSKPLICH